MNVCCQCTIVHRTSFTYKEYMIANFLLFISTVIFPLCAYLQVLSTSNVYGYATYFNTHILKNILILVRKNSHK